MNQLKTSFFYCSVLFFSTLFMFTNKIQSSFFCFQNTTAKPPTKQIDGKNPEELYAFFFGKSAKERVKQKITPKEFSDLLAPIIRTYQKLWKKNLLTNYEHSHIGAPPPSPSSSIPLFKPIAQKYKMSPNEEFWIHGDVNGDVFSLLRVLAKLQEKKQPSKGPIEPLLEKDQKLILLGDYTNGNTHDLDTISLIAHLVEKYPDNIFLLRGDREILRDPSFEAKNLQNCLEKKLLPTEKKQALKLTQDWYKTASYFPQLLFIELPNCEILVAMHGAPPSKSLCLHDETQKSTFNLHCLCVKQFLDDNYYGNLTRLPSTEAFKKKPDIRKSFISCASGFPFLCNFLISLQKKNQEKSYEDYYYQQHIGGTDLKKWVKKTSSKNSSITKIFRAHHINNEDVGEQFLQEATGPLCYTLASAPDEPDKKKGAQDAWIRVTWDQQNSLPCISNLPIVYEYKQ